MTSNRCRFVGRTGISQTPSPESDDADRHIDEEDPLPIQFVNEHSADQRPCQGGDPDGGAPDARRDAAMLRREDARDHRQYLRGEQRCAQALDHARHH
jgi:hypothetical protein